MSDVLSGVNANTLHPYAYTLYGQHIHSNEPLPLWAAQAKLTPTLTFTFVPSTALPNLDDATLHYAYPYFNGEGESMMQVLQIEQVTGLYYWMHTWTEGGWADFLLREDGRLVLAIENAGYLREKLIPLLLGSVTSWALRLQGFTSLHAAAVLADGGVVAFCGPSNTGKSTTLAALVRQGADFFSDDLVPLTLHEGQTLAYPGYPRIGLWPDAMTALYGPAADLPPLELSKKRIYTPATTHDVTKPSPIRAIYIFSPRGRNPDLSEVAITPFSQGAAVTELMPHTTGLTVRTLEGHANDFARIAALARTIPIQRVDRPNDIRQLDAVAQAILHDVNRLPKVAI